MGKTMDHNTTFGTSDIWHKWQGTLDMFNSEFGNWAKGILDITLQDCLSPLMGLSNCSAICTLMLTLPQGEEESNFPR